MDRFSAFISSFDTGMLVVLLISVLSCVLCITVHELCHGLTALMLGDRTARQAGRLTLNPLAHIDPVGLLMLLVARVGWAKPVPVNLRAFRHPKRDMALTALAGPVSNFALAFVFMPIASALYRHVNGMVGAYALFFVCYIIVLSVGLGLFNLIPIPPLDGSKIVSAVLPASMYRRYMQIEHYLLIVVVALAWFGFFSGPLGAGINWVIRIFCNWFDFPFSYFTLAFGL